MREIYIIAGPNGSGKTTFADEWIQEIKLPFLNADNIARELEPSGNFHKVRLEAGKRFFRQFHSLVEKGQSFVVETTLSGMYFQGLIKKMKEKGYNISLIFIIIESVDEALKRIRQRVQKGGHDIPDQDVIRRFTRSQRNFWNLYRYLVNQWKLMYNSEDDFMLIALGEKNDYKVIDEKIFSSFLDFFSGEKK